MKPIKHETILKMIEKLIKFPLPSICKHSVALDLLSMLEVHGYPVTHELASAICDANDEEAISLFNNEEVLKGIQK